MGVDTLKIFLKIISISFLLIACVSDSKKTEEKKEIFLEGNPSQVNAKFAQKYFKDYEFTKALKHDLLQLEIDLKYYKEESLEIALDYNNIGLDYDELKNHKKALEYYLKSMKIDEIVLDKNSTERSTTYYNVASSYDALGEYDNAIKYYAKALAIDKVKLGIDHKNVLAEYEKLAIAYEKISKFNNSLRYWKNALRYKEHEYGKYDLDTNETRAEVLKLEKIVKAEKELLKKIK